MFLNLNYFHCCHHHTNGWQYGLPLLLLQHHHRNHIKLCYLQSLWHKCRICWHWGTMSYNNNHSNSNEINKQQQPTRLHKQQFRRLFYSKPISFKMEFENKKYVIKSGRVQKERKKKKTVHQFKKILSAQKKKEKKNRKEMISKKCCIPLNRNKFYKTYGRQL